MKNAATIWHSIMILMINSLLFGCSDGTREQRTSKVQTSDEISANPDSDQSNPYVTVDSNSTIAKSGRVSIAEISRTADEELFQIKESEAQEIGFSEPVMVTGAQLVSSADEKCEPLSYTTNIPKVSDLPGQTGNYVFCIRAQISGTFSYSFSPSFNVFEATGKSSELAAKSCLDILSRNQGLANGLYWLSQDGTDESSFQVYCDMETDGGGWTLIAAQFESDQLTDWNEGTQSDYDPDLLSERSFTLSSLQLPPHTRTSFGQGKDPLFITSVEFQYQTGDIPLTEIKGADGQQYQIHRDKNHYYHWHNPEESQKQNAPWHNALTLDLMGGRHYTWSYSPMVEDQRGRGLGMLGNQRYSDESYAWTVWVR